MSSLVLNLALLWATSSRILETSFALSCLHPFVLFQEGGFRNVRNLLMHVYQRLGERLAKLFSGVIVRDMRETSKGQEHS